MKNPHDKKYKTGLAEKGLCQVHLVIPKHRRAEFLAMARIIREWTNIDLTKAAKRAAEECER